MQDTLWTESCSNLRSLKHPGFIQPGMLEFNPRTVQAAMIAKFCATTGRSQRFAILDWGLVNPEKITEFLERMERDMFFRSYYHGIYVALRLLHKRIFDHSSLVVLKAEKKWSSKLD